MIVFFLFFLFSIANAMGCEYASQCVYALQEERRQLESQGALYYLDPAAEDYTAPLTRENVMNPYPYWRSMENNSQADKDDALKAIVEFFHGGDDRYYLMRRIVAASVLGGANPNFGWFTGMEYGILRLAVQRDDLELARLLLKHKADPCSKGIYRRPCIFEAKTKAMVGLLIDAGAKVDPDRDFTLLHQSMDYTYGPDLVTVYRNNCVSPFAVVQKTGNTPLHLLSELIRARDADAIDQIIEKSTRLFDGLSPVQTIRLCTMTNREDKTALDILRSKIESKMNSPLRFLGHPSAEKFLRWLEIKLLYAKKAA